MANGHGHWLCTVMELARLLCASKVSASSSTSTKHKNSRNRDARFAFRVVVVVVVACCSIWLWVYFHYSKQGLIPILGSGFGAPVPVFAPGARTVGSGCSCSGQMRTRTQRIAYVALALVSSAILAIIDDSKFKAARATSHRGRFEIEFSV